LVVVILSVEFAISASVVIHAKGLMQVKQLPALITLFLSLLFRVIFPLRLEAFVFAVGADSVTAINLVFCRANKGLMSDAIKRLCWIGDFWHGISRLVIRCRLEGAA
jgi:hypothetical protein